MSCIHHGPTEVFAFAALPWTGVSDEGVLGKLREGSRIPQPVGCPNDVYQAWHLSPCSIPLLMFNKIMTQCWEVEPEERLTPNRLRELLHELDLPSFRATFTDLNPVEAAPPPKPKLPSFSAFASRTPSSTQVRWLTLDLWLS